jgi:hypothetical protein
MLETQKLVCKTQPNEPINQIPFIEEQIVEMIGRNDNSITTSPKVVSE